MDASPKRRWYQFSLGTLLAVMLAISLLLGVCGRIAFLLRQAEFHDQERMSCIDSFLEMHKGYGSPRFLDGKSPEEMFGRDGAARIREMIARSLMHQAVAKNYRQAVYRPWTVVDDSPPLEPFLKKALPNPTAPAPNPPQP
jgi:hypothetical protein